MLKYGFSIVVWQLYMTGIMTIMKTATVTGHKFRRFIVNGQFHGSKCRFTKKHKSLTYINKVKNTQNCLVRNSTIRTQCIEY